MSADLVQVLVGSSFLGVITQAAMQLEPLPERREFLSFGFPSINEGIEAGRRIMVGRLRPAVVRLYDEKDTQKLASWIDADVEVLLVLMCDGPSPLVDYEVQQITQVCGEVGGKLRTRTRAVVVGPSTSRSPTGRHLPRRWSSAQPTPAPASIDSKTSTGRRKSSKKASPSTGPRTPLLFPLVPVGSMIYDRFYIDEAPSDPDEAMALHDRLSRMRQSGPHWRTAEP